MASYLYNTVYLHNIISKAIHNSNNKGYSVETTRIF